MTIQCTKEKDEKYRYLLNLTKLTLDEYEAEECAAPVFHAKKRAFPAKYANCSYFVGCVKLQ